MKCPKCNSTIPDDSQYCPDCGNRIEHEDDLRKEAASIASSYKKGYNHYVSNGTLPQFSSWLSVEAYNKIISLKESIINKNKELIDEEKERVRRRRREEEQQKRENQQKLKQKQDEVWNLYINNMDGYKYYVEKKYVPDVSDYSKLSKLTISECDSILIWKTSIESSEKHLNQLHNDYLEMKYKKSSIDENPAEYIFWISIIAVIIMALVKKFFIHTELWSIDTIFEYGLSWFLSAFIIGWINKELATRSWLKKIKVI